MSYTNSPPKYKTTLKLKLLPLFLSPMINGKSLRGRHLIITERASIILIITSIIILISRGLWRRRWRRSKTDNASLSACYATNSGVHLTHLICEIVKMTTKVNLHSLKLHHDGLQDHTTSCGGRRSRGRWNNKSCRICCLYSWPLWSKLGLAPPTKTSADGTHGGEERRGKNGNVKVCEDTRDSRREDKLIMCSSIQIHI